MGQNNNGTAAAAGPKLWALSFQGERAFIRSSACQPGKARAALSGHAGSLVCSADSKLLQSIVNSSRLLARRLEG